MLPTIHEFYSSDPAANILVSLERLLTLAVPNTYFWLLGFYAFFHLMLNLLAEVDGGGCCAHARVVVALCLGGPAKRLSCVGPHLCGLIWLFLGSSVLNL